MSRRRLHTVQAMQSASNAAPESFTDDDVPDNTVVIRRIEDGRGEHGLRVTDVGASGCSDRCR